MKKLLYLCATVFALQVHAGNQISSISRPNFPQVATAIELINIRGNTIDDYKLDGYSVLRCAVKGMNYIYYIADENRQGYFNCLGNRTTALMTLAAMKKQKAELTE
jgi:hypothetical protein